ncbi:MAG: 5'-methylthioadenosine/adenosylhomocysteine nucleosidase [Oscillospiraceae bacterium]|nr:5'-methylthioadenosine/adenosylhomocysteine nucleosidase [Oscillospiraceae bacterium]
MTKLGIIGAMAVEVATLKEKMENPAISWKAGMEFCDGVLEGIPAVVVQCGVGKVNAAMCVQILCDCFGVTAIVNTGIAGSLCAELDIGDIVVSKDAMYHDFDVTIFGRPMGQVPGMDVVAFPADGKLMAYAFAAAEAVNPGHTKTGRVASGDQFVSRKDQKAQIIADTQALCTEMEGAAIAHAAYRNEVPFVIIRAISDKADDSAEMDYPTFEAIAAQRCAEVTTHLARQIREAN